MEKARLRRVQVWSSPEPHDLFANPNLSEAASQLGPDWPVMFVENTLTDHAILVESMYDGYRAWLPLEAAEKMVAVDFDPPKFLDRDEIEERLSAILDSARLRESLPNEYRWGGNQGPNFDCSGFVQWSFRQHGAWLPRDAYHLADFAAPIDREELEPGDLVFFGTDYVSHVALWLGDNQYIHSSGAAHGHNGIAIDHLNRDTTISAHYYDRVLSFGRVQESLGA